MRHPAHAAAALLLALACAANSQEPLPLPAQSINSSVGASLRLQISSTAQAVPSGEDPVLRSLLREVLANNHDLQRGQSLVEAEKERITQAKALPDPSLSLGLQNDGFKRLEVGRMETSYYLIMATQPLPWPGKRELRGEIAALGSEAQRNVLSLTRLTLEADVKRAYFGLLLVRGQLVLLDQQAQLLETAEGITKARYEVGQGSQADLLRAQLERTRLREKRLGLEAEEGTLLAEINHLRREDHYAPLPTPTALTASPLPAMEEPGTFYARAEPASPEIQAARLNFQLAERSLDLARLDRRPDFAVSAGLMPRGGLDPMWQVGFSIGLPIFSRQKQQRAVTEQGWRRLASGSELESVRHMLRQRTEVRYVQFSAALATLKLYREGLLIQSESSFSAALAQYEAGRAPFLSVLEALNGWIADRSGFLQAQAQALSISIAQEELSLAPTLPIRSQALGAPASGMGGAAGSVASKPSSSRPTSSAAGSGSMKSM
jgi:cobalt-zinc-cadmium efflux system outer membrane protein